MVTIEASVDECIGNEKFNFSSITRKFRFTKESEEVKEEKPDKKKKFSLRRFFGRRKKKEPEPEVEFSSGYGKLLL